MSRITSVLVCLFSLICGVAAQRDIGPPSFAEMPPQFVEFSNMTGTRIPCLANPRPRPSNISWIGPEGSKLKPIPGLREVLPDGTLVLHPFRAEQFRQDVHSTFYKCALTNNLGTVVSNDVTVKAVVLQPYDVYVYDVYTMTGSTAVIKCHVPKVISAHIAVTSWIKDSTETVSAFGASQESRLSIIPSGELYIKDVTTSDGRSTFECVATNKLTGETKKSVTSGKLFVTDPQGNVPPKIIFSKKTIRAKEGEMALLPCEAQAYPLPNIRWSRSSDVGQHTGLSINDRYSLVSGSLLIKNVHQSDSGVYTCTASNVAGSVKVEVQVVISEPLVVTIDPAKLIVDNNKPGTLNCKISGGQVTSITWMKDGRPLGSLPAIKMLSNTSVHVSSVSSEHKGIYQCLAKSNSEEAFGVAVLTLGDSPPILASGFKELALQPGTSADLQCIFSGSPTPEVTWLLDGQAISSKAAQTQSVNGDNNIVASVSLKNLKNQDGGMYSCQASNTAGNTVHSARLNIYGMLGSRQRMKMSAISGGTVVLNCPFYGYPFTSIKWEKDERALPSNVRQVVLEKDSLMIQEVNRLADSGIYTCNVQHDGKTVRGEVQLVVVVPPKLAPFSFQDELVREGMRGRLQCVVLEGDLPISLSWLKDSQPIPSSLGVTVREIDEFSSILTIPYISPRHNGNYTCLAKNPAASVAFTAPLSVNGNFPFNYSFSSSADPAVCFPR